MDEHGKFGEHEKSVRVAGGVAESNSSFLSNNSIQTQVVLEKKQVITAMSGLPGNRVITENYE